MKGARQLREMLVQLTDGDLHRAVGAVRIAAACARGARGGLRPLAALLLASAPWRGCSGGGARGSPPNGCAR